MVISNSFISETTLAIRDILISGVSDPISSSRTGDEKFVVTGYPQRTVKYPILTVLATNSPVPTRLGLRSEMAFATVELEIRIWARNNKERDVLTDLVHNQLRGIQTDASTGTIDLGLYGFQITSMVNVSEEGPGAIQSKVITVKYNVVLT